MRIATDNLCLIFLLLCSFISRSPNLSRLFSSPISVEPSASAWLWQGHLCGAAEFVEIIFFSSSPFPALNNTILPVLGTPRRIKKKKELRPTSALRRLSNPQAGALSLDCCLRHHSLLVTCTLPDQPRTADREERKKERERKRVCVYFTNKQSIFALTFRTSSRRHGYWRW